MDSAILSIVPQTAEEKLALQRAWEGLMARCPPLVLPPQMVKRMERYEQLVAEGVLRPLERQPAPPPVVLALLPAQDVAMRPSTEIAAQPPATIVPLPPPMEMPPELRPTKKRSRWSSEDEADEVK